MSERAYGVSKDTIGRENDCSDGLWRRQGKPGWHRKELKDICILINLLSTATYADFCVSGER